MQLTGSVVNVYLEAAALPSLLVRLSDALDRGGDWGGCGGCEGAVDGCLGPDDGGECEDCDG